MQLLSLLIFLIDNIFSIQEKKNDKNAGGYKNKIYRHKFCNLYFLFSNKLIYWHFYKKLKINFLEKYFIDRFIYMLLKLKELAVSQRQAHDDLVNSDFLI